MTGNCDVVLDDEESFWAMPKEKPDDWGPRIQTPGPTSVCPEGPIEIRPDGDNYRILKSHKGYKGDMGSSSYLQFRSRIVERVKVRVRR
jgi:hypothetical protein